MNSVSAYYRQSMLPVSKIESCMDLSKANILNYQCFTICVVHVYNLSASIILTPMCLV